jgi:hypothetical protein
VKDLENLGKDLKALERENSLLHKTNDKLQARLKEYDIASSSTPSINDAKFVEELTNLKEELSLHVKTNEQLEAIIAKYGLDYFPTSSSCDIANIHEENVRLSKEIAKLSTTKNKMSLDDLLSKQRSPNNKSGLGYTSYSKKKKNNKSEMPAQAKNKKVVGRNKASKGKVPINDHTGPNNDYVLFKDYHGDIYAKYDGPYDGFIAYSIWVPKTHVTNMRGPIGKWVTKTKQ